MKIFNKQFINTLDVIDTLSQTMVIPERLLEVPHSYASKIIKELKDRGLIETKEGRGGGIKLTVSKSVALSRVIGGDDWQIINRLRKLL